jgi:glycosyltransferase involved in cell wall biosynthesis
MWAFAIGQFQDAGVPLIKPSDATAEYISNINDEQAEEYAAKVALEASAEFLYRASNGANGLYLAVYNFKAESIELSAEDHRRKRNSSINYIIQMVSNLAEILSNKKRTDEASILRRDKNFTFLYCGALNERKGYNYAIDTFKEFHKAYPDTRLVIKTTEEGMTGETEHSDEGIVYIFSNVSEEEMAKLYNFVDCLLLPSHGEGVGLTALEAAACGVPIIHTPYGGTEDFLSNSNSLHLGFRMMETEVRGHKTKWAEPDQLDIFERMEQAYKKEELKANFCSIDVSDFTWKKFVGKIFDVLKKAQEEAKRIEEKLILNLGAGNDKFLGAVNVDIRAKTKPDVVCDISQSWAPIREFIGDKEVDEIYAFSVFEHVPDIIHVMKQSYDFLKMDGLLIVKVPHYKSITAYTDPTHVRFFTEQSMDYFDQTTYYGSINNYAEVNFKILEVRIVENLPDENYRDILFVLQKKEYED